MRVVLAISNDLGRKMIRVPLAMSLLLSAGAGIAFITYRYGWIAGLAVATAPVALAGSWGALPIAFEKVKQAFTGLKGVRFVFLLLVIACSFEAFFPEINYRSLEAVKQSPVNTVNLVRVLLIGAAGAWTILVSLRQNLPLSLDRKGPLKWFLFYSLFALVSASYARLPIVSAGKALEVVSETAFFCLIVALLPFEEMIWAWNIIWGSTALLLTAMWVSALASPSTGFEYPPGALLPVVTGSLPVLAPNGVGQHAAGLAIVSLIRLIDGSSVSRRRETRLWGGLLALGLVSLVSSQARTSIASFCVASCLILYWRRKLRLLASFALAAVGLAGVGLIPLVTSFLRRGQDATALLSLTGRINYWQVAWDMFLESKWFGYGFYTAHRIDLSERFRFLDLSTVDNTYLEVLLGVGLIGTFPLVVALVRLGVNLFRSGFAVRTYPLLARVRYEMAGFFIIVVIRSVTGPSFQVHGHSMVLLLLVMAFTQRLVRGGTCDGRIL